MGKPSGPTHPGREDAMSLHTQPGDRHLLDDDAPELQTDNLRTDDLPPLYHDALTDALAGSSSGGGDNAPLLPQTETYIPNVKKDANNGREYYIDPRFDNDPEFLEKMINHWAQTPPRVFVRLMGTHQATVEQNGKKERRKVTDFDVHIEVTPYLYRNATNRIAWRELRTVENSEQARRGTVLRKRAPGAKQSIEIGMAEKPTLAEWCHRYCASHAGLKSFALQRRVMGFNENRIREKLVSLIRSTNYRGTQCVSFYSKEDRVEVYNDCKTSEWRLTSWVWWICVLTLTFIFTWPYLFVRTKRFEVVMADWYFSKAGENGRREYVSVSEDEWYNMWGRAINRAILGKQQRTLDQHDLVTADAPEPTFDNPVVDGAVSFVRAGVNAMNEVNRQLGWGYDE